MTSADTLRAGADALIGLMTKIERISNTIDPEGDVASDFRAVAAAIEALMQANLALPPDARHRAGWLPEADVLSTAAAGCSIPIAGWYRIATTQVSFEGADS